MSFLARRRETRLRSCGLQSKRARTGARGRIGGGTDGGGARASSASSSGITADGSDIMASGGECREAGRWCQQVFGERFREDGEDGSTGPAHVSPRRVDDDRTRSASLPTGVKEVVTLLVKSRTRGKAVLHRTFEGQRDHIDSTGDTQSPGVEDCPSRLNQQSRSWPGLSRDITRRSSSPMSGDHVAIAGSPWAAEAVSYRPCSADQQAGKIGHPSYEYLAVALRC